MATATTASRGKEPEPATKKPKTSWRIKMIKVLGRILSPYLKWLAEESVLVTTVRESTVKAIMRGNSFDHFIMAFAGYHLNDPRRGWYKTTYDVVDGTTIPIPDWEVVYHGKGNEKGFDRTDDEYYDVRSEWTWLDHMLKDLGLYWIGWPWSMNVFVYPFEWNETMTDKTSGEEKIFPRAEPTDFIFVADFIYAILTVGAETADRLRTDELTLVTIAVRNPYRALFSGEDWMRRITATINRHVRTFVGSRDYQGLISPTSNEGVAVEDSVVQDYWKAFSVPIIALNERLPDDAPNATIAGLKRRYGIEIRTAELQTMDLSGDGKEALQGAAAKRFVATQVAGATLLEGAANADVIKMKGDREAEALDARLKVAEKYGDLGALLLQLDAMQAAGGEGSSKIIWANNPFDLVPDMLNPMARKRRREPEMQKGGKKS